MKYIILIGTGYSGSSAIKDYLMSRGDFASPFYNQEFRLINDPDGLDDLYFNLYKNFSLNTCSESFHRFIKFRNNLSNIKIKINNKKLNLYSKEFNKITQDFLNKITEVEYEADPYFRRIRNYTGPSYYINYFTKKNYLGASKVNKFFMRVPCNENKFIMESKKMIKKVIINDYKFFNKSIKNIILDQSANLYNPISAFKYFKNLKIIVVTRDPRSIYYSMKTRKSLSMPGYNLKKFVKWYNDIMIIKNNKKVKNKNILYIKFENFAKNFETETLKINKFLNLKNKTIKNFNISNTLHNAYKADIYLSNFEKKYIKSRLKKYLQW